MLKCTSPGGSLHMKYSDLERLKNQKMLYNFLFDAPKWWWELPAENHPNQWWFPPVFHSIREEDHGSDVKGRWELPLVWMLLWL